MNDKRKHLFVGYGLAVASTVVATWLHLLARPILGESVPYIMLFPAVFVTAIFARFGPTLLAVMLSALAAAQWFVPPGDSLLPDTVSAWLGMILFSIFGVGVAWLAERLHRKSEQLEQEHERFFVTLSSIGDGVIVVDKRARVTFVNGVAEQLTGWAIAESKGKPLETVFQIVNEQTRKTVENSVLKVLREGRVFGLAKHTILIGRDGSERAIDDTASPIRRSDGGIVGAVLVFRDVTQQRESQMAAGRLAALVDSSEDAILGQTFEGVITNWNAGAERLFGFKAEEVVGESIFSKIVPQDRREELLQVLRQVQQGEGGQQFDTVRQRRDGRNIPVSVWISPIYDASGEVVGASAIDRDISEQRNAEKRRNARLAVTQILAQAASVEIAVKELLAIICSALEWDVGCFWRRLADDQALRCQEVWDAPSGNTAEFYRATMSLAFESGESLPGRVWETRQPVWVGDVLDDPHFVRAPQAKQSGLHGGFACPVSVGDEFVGVIEFFSHEIREPDEDLLEMLATIGGQLGQFIDRREAEQKLRRSEQELNDFFENAAVGLHWVGPDGTIVRVNQAELDLLGYTRDEYLGQHIAEFHADEAVIEDILRCLSAGEQLHEYEARLRCKDGSIKTVLIDSNVLWEGEEFIHTRCFTRDITDRKRIAAWLQESEERLRLALEAGRMGTWEWSIPTGEVIWSPTLEKVHGLEPGSFPGTFESYQNDMHPDDRQRVLESIRQTVEEGREHHLEYRIIWPDGSVHWLEARGKLFHDDSGQPVRVVGVCSDISERKRLEHQLQQQMQELADGDRRKDEFLAMLAHELRNPLVPIRSGLDILAMDAGNHHQTIVLMQEQVEHIVRLVDDLLDVSRIMRDKVQLRKESVQLSTLVNRSVGAVRPLIDNQQQQLIVSMPEEPIWLHADSVRLVQVIENLLTNASKYMNAGGRIDLTAECHNGRVLIIVQDTGIGIERELLPNVFQLFTQSSRSLDRSQGGLGIGLTLVQRLVQLHGGTVSASSDGPGQGSTFTVQLPEAIAPLQTETSMERTCSTQARRILVVDDNEGSAWLLSKLLAKFGDHQVQTANDGPSALAKIRELHPEIVLLDIGLPGMDGYQVGRKVREDSDLDDVLLVALTGYGTEEDRQRSKEAGIDEHLVKPPSVDQLKVVLSHPKLTVVN